MKTVTVELTEEELEAVVETLMDMPSFGTDPVEKSALRKLRDALPKDPS